MSKDGGFYYLKEDKEEGVKEVKGKLVLDENYEFNDKDNFI